MAADYPSDAALLERFVSRREEAAFATLMRRHAGLVRSACRRVLASEHDAEDVVQATFLLLALKAGDVAWRDSVGGWLRDAACRLSLDARSGVWRRARRETPLSSVAGRAGGEIGEERHGRGDPFLEVERRDLRRLIDAELSRLPEKYRGPVVLCDLEGLSHADAARRLGLPPGSISRRLARARAVLRGRLSRGGFLTAVVLVAALAFGLRPANRDTAQNPSTSPGLRHARGPFRCRNEGGLDLAPLLAGLRKGDRSEAEAAAGRATDARAVREAATRADAACVRCHLAFGPASRSDRESVPPARPADNAFPVWPLGRHKATMSF